MIRELESLSAAALECMHAASSGCGVLSNGRPWVQFEGFALKEGGLAGGLHPRYLVVSGDRLEYFEEKKVRLELRPGDGERSHCWSALHASSFNVRGPSWVLDRRKRPSAHSSQLLAVEVFRARLPVPDASERAGSPAQTLNARTSIPLRGTLVVSLIVPCEHDTLHVVFYFGLHASAAEPRGPALFDAFLVADDAWRRARFKMIPRVQEGPWLVRTAIGSRPVVPGPAGIELAFHVDAARAAARVDLDCGSTAAARRIFGPIFGSAGRMVVDLAFLLQAESEAELPERVLGCGRLSRIRLDRPGAVPTFRAT